MAGEESRSLKVRSIVGVVPIYAICMLKREQVDRLPGFRKRLEWFLNNSPGLAGYVSDAESENPDFAGSKFIALVPKDRLLRVLRYVLDESEFLSDYGVRALSKYHEAHPFETKMAGQRLIVNYLPGEGDSRMFGGNSNWRGPIWFPINILLLNALQRYHAVYGDALKVECPAGSGNRLTLLQVEQELAKRLADLFKRDGSGRRPAHGNERRYIDEPHWRDLVLFNEYFCGDTGRGIGASHQTGWTALAGSCLSRMHGVKKHI